MTERLYTATLSKENALRLYGVEVLQYELTKATTPETAEAFAATLALARKRYAEIGDSPASEFDIEMFYHRPKDVINCMNRHLGDEEL